MYTRWLMNMGLSFVFSAAMIPAMTGEAAAGNAGDAAVATTFWNISGRQSFVTSFPSPGGEGYRVVSRLQYPMAGQYREMTVEMPSGKRHALRVGFANSNIKTGRGDDTDWDYAQRQDMWYYGTFQAGGGVSGYNIEIVNKHAGFETVIGYRGQNNYFRMREGHYEIDEYLPVDQTLPALDSTYKINYAGIWLGLQGKKAVGNGFSVAGGIFYSPYMQAKAYGDWNLRPMTFEERGVGQGFEGETALTYAPNPHVDISLGYRFRWLKQTGGVDKTNYNGVTYTADWDEAVSVQRGIVTKINYRF